MGEWGKMEKVGEEGEGKGENEIERDDRPRNRWVYDGSFSSIYQSYHCLPHSSMRTLA